MKSRNVTTLLAVAAGSMLVFAGAAGAGVVASKHNLSSTSTVGNNQVSDTDSVCVFCHTPHGAANGVVPLWNKALPSGPYTLYGSQSVTLDGSADLSNGVSLACLSCHDGSQSMDNMINAPGSDGYVSTGQDMAYTWSGATVDAAGKLIVGTGSGITLIGTDLSDDHPVGIQYAGGGYSVTTPTIAGGAVQADPDFNEPTYVLDGANSKWWIDDAALGGDGDGNVDSDEVRMYTRTVAAAGFAGVDEPFVECASCHDPHNSTTSTFLRQDNVASAVCVACHTK